MIPVKVMALIRLRAERAARKIVAEALGRYQLIGVDPGRVSFSVLVTREGASITNITRTGTGIHACGREDALP